MSRYDMVIRNGALVRPEGLPQRADIAIGDGVIAAIGPEIEGDAVTVVDATDLHVFPGLIDPHVHFNEPGRTDWEGIASGSAAIAAGGGSLYFDMPLNAHPPTIDGPSFELKYAAATAYSRTDFALWGGLVPGTLEHLQELAERGVIGFKAFMSNSGIEDFEAADDDTLYEGMQIAARLGRIVAVHAENEAITGARTRRAIAAGKVSARDYLATRPIASELEAISRAIILAEQARCRLHIVHISTGRGVALVAQARARGIDVSCETCPHYLVLTETDLEQLGSLAKCAPPLRSQEEQDSLWKCLAEGTLPIIASDHSPAPARMKTGDDFFRIWGGISGCQSTLQLLLTEGHVRRSLPLATIARATSAAIAERFGIAPRKGCLSVGADADMALVDMRSVTTLAASDLHYRHQHSPYIGRMMQGHIVRTILRGHTIYREGTAVGPPTGRLVMPNAGEINGVHESSINCRVYSPRHA